MKPGPRFLGRAGSVLAGKLAQYERYRGLLGDQEDALDQGDLESFHRLAEEAEGVRNEVESGGAEESELSAEERAQAAEIIGEAVAHSVRLRERLSEERGATLQQIRQMTRRGPQARRYLAEPAAAGELGPRLDVRS